METLTNEARKHWWAIAIFLVLILGDIVITHIGVIYLGAVEGNPIMKFLIDISIWLADVVYFIGACLVAAIVVYLKKIYVLYVLSFMCAWVIAENIATLLK